MTQLSLRFQTCGTSFPRYTTYSSSQNTILSNKTSRFASGKRTSRLIKALSERAQIVQSSQYDTLFAPDPVQALTLALEIARMGTGKFHAVFLMNPLPMPGFTSRGDGHISAEALFRAGLAEYLPGGEHIPPPDPTNCLWDNSGDCHACGLRCASYMKQYLSNNNEIAAVVAEPLFNAPKGYFDVLRSACDTHNVFFILDVAGAVEDRTPSLPCNNFQADLLIYSSTDPMYGISKL
ncbi:hypothetical protein [Desulfovibrio inopinatus]|uniref:hypothetical protein n=1 Tax=Desulfovibrio inopinatus TaxID=102109 RepID=UPI00146FB36C|nr:hypothetical protein [Desulfovibrio inopinatus]